MPPELLAAEWVEMLRCPQTGQSLAVAPPELMAELNSRISRSDGGGLRNQAGAAVQEAMDGGLLRSDGGAVYPVRDGIPVLLIDEAVPLPLP